MKRQENVVFLFLVLKISLSCDDCKLISCVLKREYVVAEVRKNGERGDWGKLQGREELSIMAWKVKKYLKDLFFFILKELSAGNI